LAVISNPFTAKKKKKKRFAAVEFVGELLQTLTWLLWNAECLTLLVLKQLQEPSLNPQGKGRPSCNV
jgi:hypothetical protein